MKRLDRKSKRFLEQMEMPCGGPIALVAAIVNQAIIDYNHPPTDQVSKEYMAQIHPAGDFLKEWNIIK
jgi:hypothetical protein